MRRLSLQKAQSALKSTAGIFIVLEETLWLMKPLYIDKP